LISKYTAIILKSRDWRSQHTRDFEAAWRSPSHSLLNMQMIVV